MKNYKRAKWALGCVAVLLLVALGVGLHIAWPFMMFPKTEISIIHAPALPAEPQETLLAGVAVRDITAPIGIPKMGYSAWSRPADGFRTRLKARAFYIKPKNGLPVAVVQADLPASSLLLHHRVAELIAAKTDIPAQSLSIHVTHTHSGPGQFYASDFYNAFGANKPGFDPDVYEFLATQISDAVIAAYKSRQPARIAVGETELYGATKNRSMGAYILNENVTDKAITEANALKAVNPAMTMVRIDVQQGDQFLPLGVFTAFAVHGTGIPAFTKPYHGDVWAFFERDLQWQIKRHYHTPWLPVHGPFESTHGDNNPNYEPSIRGDLESRRIGKLMAQAGWDLFKSLDEQLTDDVTVMTAMRELDLLALRPQDTQDVLCPRAVAGTALAAGATGDEIFPISYLPPFRRGWPKSGSDDCQAEKNYLFSGLQTAAVDRAIFPRLVSLSALRIGDLIMVGLPFEVTYEAGNRIARAMQQAVPDAPKNAKWVVSSHTNGFLGYAVTREEYSAQWYEGGHTLYGPGTTKFLQLESAKLVADMFIQPGYADMPEQWQFKLATAHFFPKSIAATGQRSQRQPPQYSEAGNNKEAYWSVRYLDVNPSKIDLHQPLVSVQYRPHANAPWQPAKVDGMPLDDQGYDMQVLYLQDQANGMAEYELRWFNPVAASGQYRFAVQPRNGLPTFHSEVFTVQ
ncbi:MAG: hypothetical protein CSA49_00315 [Gammaproteobacteria bacterium]|nr:MAG: hypothetical protein CSA49_00315 [Gammaproteobacteria bacterium]